MQDALLLRERSELYRPSGFAWVGTFMRMGIRTRLVPREHFECDRHELGFDMALLLCQCGVLHGLPVGAYPSICPCGRAFFYDGTDVWALNSPVA